jgi:polysaccharide pyruvyl transferase WcaK-like protein
LPPDIEKGLNEECIGLNLSPLLQRFIQFQESGQESLAAWVGVAAEIVSSLTDRFSQPVLLIPHVTSEVTDLWRDDYLFLRRVAQKVQKPDQVLLLGPDLNAAQTKWVISQVRAFAGARTHSTLAAISSGVPTICIGYSVKARGIAKDVYGHLEWLVNGQDLVKTPSLLADLFASLLDQEPEIRSHLGHVNSVFQQRARKAAERFAEILGSSRLGS